MIVPKDFILSTASSLEGYRVLKQCGVVWMIKRITALVLILAVFVPAHMAAANTITDIPYIRINGLRNVTSGYSMNVTNFTEDNIASLTVAIIAYDSSGKPLLGDHGNGIYTSSLANHLKNYGASDGVGIYIDRTNISYIELAIIGYAKSVKYGDDVVYPEEEWAWYSTKTKGYLNFPNQNNTYEIPKTEDPYDLFPIEYELKDYVSFYSGRIGGYYLNEKSAKAHGYHHCGLMLTEDDRMDGLVQKGDLLWAVEDREYSEDPYLEYYFSEKITQGAKEIKLYLERNGKDIEVVLTSKYIYRPLF